MPETATPTLQPSLDLKVPAKLASPGRLEMVPINRDDAIEYIKIHHRHHNAPPKSLILEHFGIHDDEGRLRGVATIQRPISRLLDDGYTCEVTRLCTDGVKNGCSMLYNACWRWAQTKGYRRIITYILESESGHSLRAAGWQFLGNNKGGSRERKNSNYVDKNPTGPKARYGMGAWAVDEHGNSRGGKGQSTRRSRL